MGKKIAIILIAILFVSIFVSGCIEESESSQNEESYQIKNTAPIPIINAPLIAYFGQSISLDASSSYDQDGKIISYDWDFGDGETATGIYVDHTYNFENDLSIQYPLIFSIILAVTDNNGSWEPIIHQIELYPKSYTFYLDSNSLLSKKPSSNRDAIKASFGKLKINSIEQLQYDLTEPIKIYPCNWNITIYIEKPQFTFIKCVSLALFNADGEKIAEEDSSFQLFNLWNEKTIKLMGIFNESVEFKSMKLIVYGFCLREKIQILYGGEKPSQIFFNFTI
jgi:hypothetical protein